MKKPPVLLKLAVLVSSVLLVGGFVCYRAGAFTWLLASNPRPAASGSQTLEPNGIHHPDTTQPQTIQLTEEEWNRLLMSSSKSMAPVIVPASPSTAGAQPSPPKQPDQTIMGGPKSAYMITIQQARLQAAQSPATQPDRTTMGGSKSKEVFIPRDVPQQGGPPPASSQPSPPSR